MLLPAEQAVAQRVVSARCSNCGRAVPTHLRAGNSCPHCGAYFNSEQSYYTGSSNSGYQRQPEPWQMWLQLMAMREYQRMLLEEQRRQERIQWATERRDAELAAREKRREANREKNEMYREDFDPDEVARHLLEVSVKQRRRGNHKAADSLCRLIVKNYPQSLAATEAQHALVAMGN